MASGMVPSGSSSCGEAPAPRRSSSGIVDSTGRSVRVPGDVEEPELRADRTGRNLHHLLREAVSGAPQGGVLDIRGGDRRTTWIGFEDVTGVERDGVEEDLPEVPIIRDDEHFGLVNRRDDVRSAGGEVVEEDRAVRKMKARDVVGVSGHGAVGLVDRLVGRSEVTVKYGTEESRLLWPDVGVEHRRAGRDVGRDQKRQTREHGKRSRQRVPVAAPGRVRAGLGTGTDGTDRTEGRKSGKEAPDQ